MHAFASLQKRRLFGSFSFSLSPSLSLFCSCFFFSFSDCVTNSYALLISFKSKINARMFKKRYIFCQHCSLFGYFIIYTKRLAINLRRVNKSQVPGFVLEKVSECLVSRAL